MNSVTKLLIVGIIVILAVVFGPIIVRMALPSWAFDRDLEKGKFAWRPISGVLIERHLGENAWEQFIIDWVGPGSIQIVEYTDAGEGDGRRERLGTKESRVAIDIARCYTLASSPDAFPVVINQKYANRPDHDFSGDGGKALDTNQGSVFFAPTALIEITRGSSYFGLHKLAAGDVLRLTGKRWSYAGQGAIASIPSRDGVASFAILRGARTTRPMALDRRIDTISGIMLVPGAGATAANGEGVVVDNDPLVANGASIDAMLRASKWTFPMPAEIDLMKALSDEQRDALSVPNAIAVGWGYAHDQNAIPDTGTAWFLRSLDETEIWEPYTSPL